MALWASDPRAAEPDPPAAKTLAAMAQARLDGHDARGAAALLDRAAAVEPHPLWLCAAGRAWLEAGDPAAATVRLERALADAALSEPARAHAGADRELAARLEPLVTAARRAVLDHDHRAAARAWLAARDVLALGRFALEAARAMERAPDPTEAERLYALAAEGGDLPEDEQREAEGAVTRLRSRVVQVARPPAATTVPWVLVGTGAALLAGAVTAFVVANEDRVAVDDAKRAAAGGAVTGMSRADALEKESTASALEVTGWLLGAVGVGAVGTGVTWLVTVEPPSSRSAVRMTGADRTWGLAARVRY